MLSSRLKYIGIVSAASCLIGAAFPAYAQEGVSAVNDPIDIPLRDDLDLPAIIEATSADPVSSSGSEFSFEQEFPAAPSEDDIRAETRREAFEAALNGLMPLNPSEIRQLLERYDRTEESVALPVYPNPKPEVVVENISLDPGTPPAVIKMAYGHVTTLTFLDSTGAPWPIKDISWAGNFEIVESGGGGGEFSHILRISPQSEFAFGNMSISLLALQTPVIITLETNRDVVHYRFDAVVPDSGPLAKTPLIQTASSAQAGGAKLSSALGGIFPQDAVRLNVSGVDGRTSAYRHGEKVFVRTPLTLLSPGWSSSASSADGTTVYEIEDTPVLLLSENGRMMQARLSDREDIFDE